MSEPTTHIAPSREDNVKRLLELRITREHKLHTLQTQLEQSINKGYDFGIVNVSLFTDIIQIESQLRELSYVLYGSSLIFEHTTTPHIIL